MKRLLYFTLPVLLGIAACRNTADQPADTKVTTPAGQLPAEALFRFDSVRNYLQQARQSQADTGKKLFLQAIDVYKNRKDAAAAIPLFRQSLRFFPDNKGYYELGNALLVTNQDSLAYQAFDMAEKLNYQPISYVLFKKACCLGAMTTENDWEKREQAIAYLKNAIENGFSDRERMYQEPKLASIREGGEFTTMFNEAMSGNGDPAAVLWNSYSAGFRPASFPYIISMETVKTIQQPPAISYDFEKFVTEMRDYKFSRDVGQEFFYMAKIHSAPAYETVIYGSRSYEAGEDLPYNPTRFYLVSYDKKGKLIDKLDLAGQPSFDTLFKVATIRQNLSFEIRDYRNTWAKPVGDDGYAGNRITRSDLVKTSRYRIDNEGRFKSDGELLGRNDRRTDRSLVMR